MATKKGSRAASHDNISLRIAGYDDIFSSFDPRPYSERALSVDFLGEARRASIDQPEGGLELRLLLPARKRKSSDESMIKKRLSDHFHRHATIMKRKHDDILRRGIVFILSGVAMMFFVAVATYSFYNINLITEFLLVMSEPAGWFFFWEGLDQVIFEAKDIMPDVEFYKKMIDAKVGFFNVK